MAEGEPSTSYAANSLIPVVPVAERRLFVGNLGTDGECTEEQLERHFSKYGTLVECRISTDRRTGKSRGFGFVTFKYVHSADKVLETPHFIIDRRVNVSRMKDESTVLEPLIRRMQSKQLYVCHMLQDISEDQLRTHFSQFGNVVDVENVRHIKTNELLGYSLISFDHPHAVELSLRTQDNQMIGNYKLHIRKSVTAEAVKKAQQSERERLDYESRRKDKGSVRYSASGDRHTSFLTHAQRSQMAPPGYPMPADPASLMAAAGYGYGHPPATSLATPAVPSRDERLAALYDTSTLYPKSQS